MLTERIQTVTRADGTNRATLNPPLKWAGGKRWQIPHLQSLWIAHRNRRLVEPFCGGLAVALGLGPERALLNDRNPNVIHFYRRVQEGLPITIPLENDSETYYAYRNRFNALLDAGHESSAEAASLFYYLNRTGYNGLCRFNLQGRFNVPFGRHTTINYLRDFSAYRHVFSNWSFTSTDVEQVAVQANDFIYADPPYDVPFTHYTSGGFDWTAQVRTAEWLANHPGPVVLTNQATDRIVALYEELGFVLSFLEAPRMISYTGERRPAREVLATLHL